VASELWENRKQSLTQWSLDPQAESARVCRAPPGWAGNGKGPRF